MSEFVTRDELNGFGQRINSLSETVSGHREALDNSKTDRRDLWSAIAHSRSEDGRIETMVNTIAKDVAKQNVYFLIANAVIVGLIVKFLGAN